MLNLQEQVVSLELAKKMKELGFPQQSLFWWLYTDAPLKDGTRWELKYKNQIREADLELSHPDDYFSAYTVGELGEFLKKENCSSGYSEEDVGWWCQSSLHDIYDVKEIDTEANARAKLAIYLAEKGLLDTKTLG